jgi:acetyl esterase
MTFSSARLGVVVGLLAGGLFAVTGAMAAEKIPLIGAGKFAYPPVLPEAKVETYKQLGELPLKLYIFSPPGEARDQRRPAIVFFFGGGWRGGTPEQFHYQCRYFAARGMVAVAADYRVASRNQTTPADCVRDAKSAVRWLREHAESLGIDPQRIVASGGSAGGHLAACTAVVDAMEHEGENTAVSSRPNALVLFNPAMNVAAVLKPKATAQDQASEEQRRLFGVDPRAISPALLVKAGTPPTLLLFGTDDGLLAGARQFADAMKQAGNRCELDLYEGQQHGFFNVGRGNNEFFRKTLISADKFLASLGYLEGEPTVEQVFDFTN